jgi:hypothetical protein
LRREILRSRLSAFLSERYRMLIFHGFIVYVALGICQENNLAGLHFSLDFIRSATYNGFVS